MSFAVRERPVNRRLSDGAAGQPEAEQFRVLVALKALHAIQRAMLLLLSSACRAPAPSGLEVPSICPSSRWMRRRSRS